MEILLIRHAQSKGNAKNTVQGHLDEGLSDLGKEQAQKLSDCFNPGDLDAIYSSDLGRAVQTAEPIAKKLKIQIQIDPDLREADFGIWEGDTYNGVKEKYPSEYETWHKNYLDRPPWFESYDSHSLRIKSVIEKILLGQTKNDRVGVFTHGGSIKTQVGFFNKLTGEDLAKISITNCSLTLLKFNPTIKYEEGNLIYYNKVAVGNKQQVSS